MIFTKSLEWDALSIQQAVTDRLTDFNYTVKTSLGYNEDFTHSAFIIEGDKKKFAIIVTLENEGKQIIIRGGTAGKYLPEGKKIPKYSAIFTHTQLKDASELFEKILEEQK